MKVKYDWSKSKIEEAVKASISYTETLRRLNVNTRGNNADTLKKKIQEYNIDISHFTGRARTYKNGKEKPKEEYFVKGSTIQSSKVKARLLKDNLVEYKCALCGLSEWMGKTLVLQLHHIDGDSSNNTLENLQLLCPNCHSQTDNYCGSANK